MLLSLRALYVLMCVNSLVALVWLALADETRWLAIGIVGANAALMAAAATQIAKAPLLRSVLGAMPLTSAVAAAVRLRRLLKEHSELAHAGA